MAGVKGMHERLSTSPSYAAKVRARIKAGGIVHLLHRHIVGELDMKPSQVQAALGLLKKVVPDLSLMNLEAQGADGQPLAIGLIAYAPQEKVIVDDSIQLPAPPISATDPESTGQRH